MEEERIEHESFGMLQISRISGRSSNLFGSSIKHQHFIELRICPGYKKRHGNEDWLSPTMIPYITVQMSNSQFAEAITSLNLGSGTPVTIKSIMDMPSKKLIKFEGCPDENKVKRFDDEFTEEMNSLVSELKQHRTEIQELSARLPKKYQTEIDNKIDRLFNKIRDTVPFIKKQFTEQMDKTILESKGEIEGFFLHKVHDLGVKKLKMEDIVEPKLLGDKK